MGGGGRSDKGQQDRFSKAEQFGPIHPQWEVGSAPKPKEPGNTVK